MLNPLKSDELNVGVFAFGSLCFPPFFGVDFRKEGICVFDGYVDMGQVNDRCEREGFGVDE